MALEKTLGRPIRWEVEDRQERTVVVGLLADPGLPTEIAEQLAEELPNTLADQPRDGMRYTFTVVSETLRRRGDARGERLIDLTAERRRREGWDFAIVLTDLPVHKDGRPLVAELSRDEAVAVLGVPALKVLRPAEQARDIVAGLILEWAAGDTADEPLQRLEDRVPSLHRVEPDDDDIDLRLTSSAGQLQMLAGMVRVNRPWRLVLGLRGALAAALATAAFGLVSSPVWQVSGAMSTIRLWIATAVSLAAIMSWLLLNHGLWQHPRRPDPRERRRIRLYNAATLLTLAIGLLVSYVVLLAGNFLTGWFVVVPQVFSSAIGRPVSFADYFRLAWLVSSLATIGGALGSGLESTDTVRSATWGTRYRKNS
ncbi:MAG: hypothetical protein JWP64_4689 [Pseudonocardia sp.]|jgi:hypothetical protein|uniref:hypothetical protein n=1 Tax=Pseudonocardia sp. TaxID=60912 RepID=UPI0026086485|nr:hypothetical protein [Pseudonocardia sp.]MCU1629740.1 hypothetical protein [Pseudonocardia sp.]MDT7702884.1 hypothetical protein [Pseudonocardiales bacterium]